MIKLYGITNCDTIKKARRWLEEAGLDYEFHDYKKMGCNAGLAGTFIEQFELDKLINKRGTTWRQFPEQDKAKLNAKTAVKLMTSQPSVIKRPIVKAGKQWLIGFDSDQWQSTLT